MTPAPPRTLGLFAKWPAPGQVKTRLAAATSPAWAAEVASAFLRDLLERLASLDARRVLVFAPLSAASNFERLVGPQFSLSPQTDGDLGRRMASFIDAELATGSEKVVFLGTDSPTLPVEFVERAFDLLDTADVVLGPATDGGYYLVGCARQRPPIFEGIAWSGPTVLGETMARLNDPAWRLALLPPWYDVDTRDDWLMLRGHLAAQRRAGIDPQVPHTEQLCSCEPEGWEADQTRP